MYTAKVVFNIHPDITILKWNKINEARLEKNYLQRKNKVKKKKN